MDLPTTRRPSVRSDSTLPLNAVPYNHHYVIGLSAVAAIGGFLFGFDSGVINGAVAAISAAFGTQTAATGFAVASVLLGCAVGAFGAGALANHIGRRPTMLFNAVIFLASAFATGAAGSATIFIAARIVGGVGIGAASVLAPMYISEIAPAHLRGRLAFRQRNTQFSQGVLPDTTIRCSSVKEESLIFAV